MDLMTISKVSKVYEVSTRTLRYYEKLGLIDSVKVEDYAYRMYDEAALARLRQIIILRKLRIPLKQIAVILNNRNGQETLALFTESIAGIDAEISALETIKNALQIFVAEIEKIVPRPLGIDTFDDNEVAELVQTLSIQTLQVKEKITMKTLNQANETVGRIADLRIIYVPPMTVAAYHAAGENREEEVTEKMSAFIMAHDLAQEKPDFRRFGFNNPAGDAAGASLGYESWVSIPPEMAVEAPYVKKEFGGGLYAAKMIRFGEFQEWGNLWQWVMTNADYNLDPMPRVEPSDAGADPALEETLDAIHQIAPKSPADIQLDLLVPIVEKGNKLICQSCGMNIDEDSLKGTEADGSLSQDYCSFCYRDGRFTTERTIDEQVEIGLGYSEEYQNARNEEEKEIIRQQTKKYLAGLKRWQG